MGALRPLLLAQIAVGSAGPLTRDQRMKQPTRVEGQLLPLSATLEAVGEAAGRPLLLSEYADDREAFVAIPGGPPLAPLGAVPPLFASDEAQLKWVQWGYQDPGYVLVPVGRTPRDQVRLAQRQVERTLGTAPTAAGRTDRQASKAARYDLLRSLSPATRARAVDEAIRKGRSLLPLSAFPRQLMGTASGQLYVKRRLTDGSVQVRYS